MTELPGTPVDRSGMGPRALLRTVRALGRPLEPDRVIVMPLVVAPVPAAPLSRRRR